MSNNTYAPPAGYPPPQYNSSPQGNPGNLPPGSYPPTGQYPPPGQYPPTGQYQPPGQYPPPGQYQQSVHYQQPVNYQQPGQHPPAQVIWMPIPQVTNCPPGLEYLTQIDQLIIIQKVELLEAFTGFETKNKYRVVNSLSQQVYNAKEETDCLVRNCCGHLRPFDMKITDNTGREVIHLYRPLACDSCCFPCCLQSMEVTSPPGTVVGSIHQEWDVFYPKFSVKNASGDTVLLIQGPFCTYSICGDVEFRVMSADGSTQVGKISKQWSGFVKEAFTDADIFGISFPLDLDVRMKAVLLGAVFLIDFMFFETQNNNQNDGVGMIN